MRAIISELGCEHLPQWFSAAFGIALRRGVLIIDEHDNAGV